MTNVWVYVFDLGNVLIFFDEERFLHKLGPACRPEAPAGEVFREAFARADVARGGDFDHVQAELVERAGLTLTRDQFRLAWNDVFTRNPPMLDLVRTLPGPRVLLSNTNQPHAAWIREQFPEVLPLFDHVVLSNEVGLVKPEAAIYRHVEALTGRPPECHVFTDDLAENIAGAQACGWTTIRFRDVEDYRRRLKKVTACSECQ